MDKKVFSRLRRKFVLTNMVLVFVVLASVFAIVLFVNYSQSESQVYNEITRSSQQAHERNDNLTKPQEKSGGTELEGDNPRPFNPEFEGGERVVREDQIVAVSTYIVTSDLEVSSTVGDSLSLDSTTRDSAISEVCENWDRHSKLQGFLIDFGLYYAATESGGTYAISFASKNYVDQNIFGLARTLGLACGAALVVFFLISYFLSAWALKPARDVWEKQKAFVADASHELKTPLTVILSNMSILKSDKSLSDSSQRWVDNTLSEAQDMQVLVEEMLELAKADSQNAKEEYKTLDFSRVVESVALHFESVAFERGSKIVSNIEPDIFILGDERQLSRLVSTLIENACKYADKAKPINIELKEDGEQCKFSVENWGETLSQEDMEHIFERFYRSDKARSGGGASFGLGLAIAREIALSHRGDISAESVAGLTKFTVTLPKFRENRRLS